MLFYKHLKARSSVGERFLDAEEAKGPIPFAPTMNLMLQNRPKVSDLTSAILEQTYKQRKRGVSSMIDKVQNQNILLPFLEEDRVNKGLPCPRKC